MESLVAFGFAANIVQFTEFVTKVISQTSRIYRAETELNYQSLDADLTQIGKQLIDYTREIQLDPSVKECLRPRNSDGEQCGANLSSKKLRIKNFLNPFTQSHTTRANLEGWSIQERLDPAKVASLSETDRDILRVCLECEEVASKLQRAIANLGSSKTTLFASFAAALRTIWSEKEIEEMRCKLDRYRQQMTTLLLSSLRNKVEFCAQEAKRAQDRSEHAQKTRHKDLFDMTAYIRNRLDQDFAESAQWKIEVLRAIKQSHQPHQHQHLIGATGSPLNTTLSCGLQDANSQLFHESLLRWIRFTDIDTRHEKIATAYERTFEWIYSTPYNGRWSDFSSWLEGEHEDLYWITGKAAAGKSTLMKFIYRHPRTTECLTRWADGRKLVKCAFYFWNSGTPIQMSEEGMMRTLLHSALREAPELWSILFPSKMEEFILFSDLWQRSITDDEIREALQNLISGAGRDYRLFVFIDGLDECGGSCEGLIDMIRKFSSSHVKVCVSSRTWLAFEDAFQSRPRLRLEALTYEDIKHYVTTRFSQSVGFQDRQLETPAEANSLIEAVTSKASGVFLWVTLVTDSLLEGLRDGEQLSQLEERLNAIPEDLEALFWKILTNTKQGNLSSRTLILQIMRQALTPLPLLAFFHAYEGGLEIPNIALIMSTPVDRAKGQALRMRRRIKACCKGLIEADPEHGQEFADATVTYLHRTVSDYLERDEIWSEFLSVANEEFSPNVRLFNACVVQLGTTVVASYGKSAAEGTRAFWHTVLFAIEYAVRADLGNTNGLQYKLLTALDMTASEVATYTLPNGLLLLEQRPVNEQRLKHWSASRIEFKSNTCFLHLAVELQLVDFVKHHIHLPTYSVPHSETTHNLIRATLDYTIFAKHRDPQILAIIPKSPSVDLVSIFLKSGADPNTKIDGALRAHGNIPGSFSPWGTHLRQPNRDNVRWIEISTIYLNHGADYRPVLTTSAQYPNEVVLLAEMKKEMALKAERRRKVYRITFLFRNLK